MSPDEGRHSGFGPIPDIAGRYLRIDTRRTQSGLVSCSLPRPLCRCLSPGDLLGCVAMRTKYGVVLTLRWPAEVRIDIFPDRIALRRHLEESAKPAFIDECVPVRQPLRVRNPRAEEIRWDGLLKHPDDVLRRWIDFEDTRERKRRVQSMRAVIEQQHIPVCEYVRGMLAGKRRSAELPIDRAGLPIDHHDRGDMPETEQDVPVRHLENPVAVRPFIAIVLDGGDAVLHRIEMLPRAPLPNNLSIGRHLDKVVAEHLAVVELGARATAADFGDDIVRERPVADQHHVPVSQPDAIVRVLGMLHLPKYLAVPIHLQRRASHKWATAEVGVVRDLTAVEEPPMFGEIGAAFRVRHLPGVNDLTAQIDEVGGPALIGREESETRRGSVRIVAAQACATTFDREGFDPRRGEVLLSERLVASSGGSQDAEPSGRTSCSNEISPRNLCAHRSGPSE